MSAGGSARAWGRARGRAATSGQGRLIIVALTALLGACEKRASSPAAASGAADAGSRAPEGQKGPQPVEPAARPRPRHAWKLAAAGGQELERALTPGERFAVPAGAEHDLDLGLAVRLHVRGPAVLASDPDGERAAYLLTGRVRVSVGADPAARPHGLALGTPCGLLTVPRAAELELTSSGVACGFALLSGYATLAAAGGGLDQRTALVLDRPLLCAAGAACRETSQGVPEGGELDAQALLRYEALVGEELERTIAQLVSIQASERAAVATLRPGPRSDDALALQRKLAASAAEALRTRARVGTLRATQRAVALVNGRSIGDDPREQRVRGLLGEGS
jgi:hypothetical protein